MFEVTVIFLTFGAVLYYSFNIGIGVIAIIGAAIAIVFSLSTRTIRGIFFGGMMGALVLLGSLALWRIDTPIPKEIFGKRAFEAKVVSVDRRLDRTLIVVTDSRYLQKLQVSISGRNSLLPGDIINLRGEVTQPQDFVTDSGRIFGYQAYLASKDIVGVINNPIIGSVQQGRFSLRRITTSIRYEIADTFTRYISFPFDGVLSGMIVGYQGGLPSSVQDLFRDTGVLHVLVLSGYNITLLAGFLALILKGVSFRARSIVTIIAIIILVLVSGAGVASVRAGIMGSIAIFAGLTIRTYQPIRALCIAYVFFFFLTPTAIFVDPGFHLSFLATLFMVVLFPKVEKVFSFIPKTKHIDVRELIVLAVTIPIFMLPYMMYFAGTFPLASPFANIIFALFIPFIMIGGIVLIILSWIVPLATILGAGISLFGKFLILFLETCAQLPIWNTPALPWFVVGIIYSVIVYVLFQKEINEYVWQRYKMLLRRSN